MKSININDDFIKLGQALKLSGLAQSGSEAKEAVYSGKVSVNNTPENRRGRKLFGGDVFEYNGICVLVVKTPES